MNTTVLFMCNQIIANDVNIIIFQKAIIFYNEKMTKTKAGRG